MNECSVKFSEKYLNYGWNKRRIGKNIVWYKGSFCKGSIDDFAKSISLIFSKYGNNYKAKIDIFLKKMTGGFAFIFESESVTIAVVDNISSIPIYYSRNDNKFILSDSPKVLKENDLLDEDSVIPLIMSGYTIGSRTLYSSIKKLTPFEYISSFKGLIYFGRYSNYLPVNSTNEKQLIDSYYDCLMTVIKDMYDNIKDKHIVVLLSGGSDSRLIASSLKHIGAKNITCMTYGIESSEEVRVSKEVAKNLGFDHVFISLNKNMAKEYFLSEEFDDYFTSMDSYSSVPYISEIYQIRKYLDICKFPSSEVVFINGNTGDFLNGSHIPDTSKNWESIGDVIDYVYNKHYSMWGYMKNDANKLALSRMLLDDLYSTIPKNFLNNISYESIYEIIEYYGRQSHLIVTNQRIYDFFGCDWKMPFWDSRYVEFWESVGIDNKVEHKLYSQAINEWNLGGVWENIPINKKSIKPNWIAPLRFFAKAILFSLNKKHLWNQVERSIFYYWMEPYRSYYPKGYKDVLSDTRGQRYYMSWWIEKYAKNHNIISKLKFFNKNTSKKSV